MFIGAGAQVGAGTRIESGVVVGENVKIRRRLRAPPKCRSYDGVSIAIG